MNRLVKLLAGLSLVAIALALVKGALTLPSLDPEQVRVETVRP